MCRLPDSVEESAIEIIVEYFESTIVRAGHREACILAAVFLAQGILNGGGE
jgi:transcription initiation factor TFIIIB Brf1 subunit/transcription initiation factor TFIIB